MGFFDRLFGRKEEPGEARPAGEPYRFGRSAGQLTDEQAIQRYRYMLQTAPPETIEQAHAEAFAKLTPEQRRMVLEQLSAELPANERAAAHSDDPQSLARMATRAEVRQPGTLERTWSQPAMGGMGMMGGMGFGGTLLTSIAGGFVGSMIAQQFFDGFGMNDAFVGSDLGQSMGFDGGATDVGAGADIGGSGGGDFGGDFGADMGGDMGGGDFGGFDM